MTGLAQRAGAVTMKHFELLEEAVTSAARVAVTNAHLGVACTGWSEILLRADRVTQ